MELTRERIRQLELEALPKYKEACSAYGIDEDLAAGALAAAAKVESPIAQAISEAIRWFG
jgi:hypothetical protein